MKREFIRNRLKDLLWVIAFSGLVVAIGRFVVGLGASTYMSDALPWGMWKIFNMVAGAAIATGGFVTAAIIYVFQIEKYRPLARVAILVAFLGYGASLTALLFDIGLPHRFWHPFLMWNVHSFLFEVFWCVSFYWMVTAFELLPIIFERLPWPRLVHFLHEIALPIIVIGVTLSTMHHSSLGSLFMTSPTRLHPLWFTTWIPLEFFTSAMGAGMALLVGIVLLYSYLYEKPANLPILAGMAKGSAAMLIVYLILKTADFTVHSKWKFVFGPDTSWETAVFAVEIALQVFIPLLIFLVPAFRNRAAGLAIAAVSASVGCVMHRVDTGIVGYFRSAGRVYYPNLSEIALSLGVMAAAALVFFFIVEHFHVFEAPAECEVEGHALHPDTADLWTLAEIKSIVFSLVTLRAGAIFALVIPIAIFALRGQAVTPFAPDPEPAVKAVASGQDLLIVNGNNDGVAVKFPHLLHQDKLGGKGSCLQCHHLGLPNRPTPACAECHTDMMAEHDIFSHDRHDQDAIAKRAQEKGVKLPEHGDDPEEDSCLQCHAKETQSPPACIQCHADDMAGMKKFTPQNLSSIAPGYREAMHGQCLTCHRRLGLQADCMTQADCIGNCQFCHPLSPEGPTIYGR